MKNEIKDNVLKLLRKHPEGLTVTQITKFASINYMTASKYLEFLELIDKIECRKIGMAKLFKLK